MHLALIKRQTCRPAFRMQRLLLRRWWRDALLHRQAVAWPAIPWLFGIRAGSCFLSVFGDRWAESAARRVHLPIPELISRAGRGFSQAAAGLHFPDRLGGHGRCARYLRRWRRFHGHHALRQSVRKPNRPMMHAQECASVLAQASTFTVRLSPRPSAGGRWRLNRRCLLSFHAFGLELLLGLADPGDFRAGVDHPRNAGPSPVRLWPGNALSTATPSSLALCASIGPRTTSPMAQTLGAGPRTCRPPP